MMLLILATTLIFKHFQYASALGESVAEQYETHISTMNEVLGKESIVLTRPSNTGPADILYVYINIMGIDSISEHKQDFSMIITMQVVWNDWRLEHNGTEDIVLTGDDINKVWLPNMLFMDSTEATISDVTKRNQLVRITPPSTVIYLTRLKLTHFCPMEYVLFPFDVQYCEVKLINFGYLNNEIQLAWNGEKAVEIESIITVSHYKKHQVRNMKGCVIRASESANVSCITFTIRLQRERNYYVWGYMYPAGGLVTLSWINFWIDITAVPARTALGMTTVLTFFTQMISAGNLTPKLGYATLMDMWMNLCQTFIFCALLEFAAVHHIYSTAKKRYENAKQSITRKKYISKNGRNDNLYTEDRPSYIPLYYRNNYSDDDVKKTNKDSDEEMALLKAEEQAQKRIALAYKVDHICRILFPLSFVVAASLFFMGIFRN